MKVRQTILIALFTLLGLNAWAGDSKIIVWLNDGSTTEVPFEEMPEFVYADGNITLKSDQGDLSWPLSKLDKFTFVSAPKKISLAGDANDDTTVNAADIVEVVNYIMGNPSGKFKSVNADANGDTTINAADIVTIVNTIMNH